MLPEQQPLMMTECGFTSNLTKPIQPDVKAIMSCSQETSDVCLIHRILQLECYKHTTLDSLGSGRVLRVASWRC